MVQWSSDQFTLWKLIAKEGKFVSFRFGDTRKAPTGLVFEVSGGKLIVRAEGGELIVEPYW